MGVAPTLYRWDDSGAPANPSSDGRTDQAALLMSVLRACLCTGYGEKSAAGWEEFSFEAGGGGTAGHLALRNGAQTGFARITTDTTYFMSGSAVGTGWNEEEGELDVRGESVGGFTSSAFFDARTARWFVVANDAAALIVIWNPPEDTSEADQSENNQMAMYIGAAMPMASELAPRAYPNFFLINGFYPPNDLRNNSSTNQANIVAALVGPDGSLLTSSGYGSVRFIKFAEYGGVSLEAVGMKDLPVAPCILWHQDEGVYARLAGIFNSLIEMESAWMTTMHQEDRYSGSVENGRVLITNSVLPGYVSLSEDDWP